MVSGIQVDSEQNRPHIHEVFPEQGEAEYHTAGGDGVPLHFHSQTVHDAETNQGQDSCVDKGRPDAADHEIIRNQKIRLHDNCGKPGVIDEVRDKMIGNMAAIGVIYSGEAIYTKRENPDLEYVVPKEGSNVWIDSWVIPKNAKHKETAEKFIDFLCRPEIALKNFDYITYSTPNVAAQELIEDEDIRNSKIAFPDASILKNCETFQYLGEDADNLYNQLWREVLGE